MKPTFFADGAAFRAWLAKHHAAETELLVGLYKAAFATKGMSYKEALDEALAYGWIDGVRKGLDEERWTIRFTPRKARSIWSLVNVKRMNELLAEGRVAPAGRAAFEARTEARTGIYSFERAEDAALTPAEAKAFRAKKSAWAFFEAQPPSYRKTAFHWVVSAKKDETRARRFALLVADSAAGRRLEHLTKYSKKRA